MKTILITDDEDKIRKLLRLVFEKRGYQVIEARDGKEAVRQYEANRPDLLITDIVMPEKEGIETIFELKKNYPGFKAIAISGGGRVNPKKYLAIAKSIGVAATMEKPLDMGRLIHKVVELVGEGSLPLPVVSDAHRTAIA